jgi:hypothetical protein
MSQNYHKLFTKQTFYYFFYQLMRSIFAERDIISDYSIIYCSKHGVIW